MARLRGAPVASPSEAAGGGATSVRLGIPKAHSTERPRGVLELHGWGDLRTELNTLSKQGKWVETGEFVDDEILFTFAVVAEPDGEAPSHRAPETRPSAFPPLGSAWHKLGIPETAP